MFTGKKLLITGGTGSFGNEVLSRFLHTDIEEIRIFSRDEKKQDDMRKKFNNLKLKFYIGDVRDLASISTASYGVDYVFHAAALKQVPSCEFFPLEAVKTNVIGTSNVLDACVSNRVKKVICLSTDKAAYPVNAMGISKAMMEKVFIAKTTQLQESDTQICGTRYGNVLNSRGSVVPLFVNQIKSGMPLTVTDPSMTRFIMSLPEAMDLVMFAFENAESGDLLIQKAPSCYIGDLALALCRIFSYDEKKINIIGTRHGEKRYEVLMTKEEASRSIDMGRYLRVPNDGRDLNYGDFLDQGSSKITATDEYNSDNTKILSVDEIIVRLLELEAFKSRV